MSVDYEYIGFHLLFRLQIMASQAISDAHSCIHEGESPKSIENVEVHDAYHSVGHSIEGIRFSCSFSFQANKNVNKEERMKYLELLYDSMTKRVDDHFGNN